MPRKPAHTPESLIEDAMHHFWHYGYAGSSMDDLVRSTGVSRHGIYKDAGGKLNLYLAGFNTYQDTVISPIFTGVESEGADLGDIEAYFDAQIALAEAIGLPGPGCHMANAMTETAPHDPEVQALVLAHNARLRAGFLNALGPQGQYLRISEREAIAEWLVIATQGFWSLSRVIDDADILRAHVATLMSLVQAKLSR